MIVLLRAVQLLEDNNLLQYILPEKYINLHKSRYSFLFSTAGNNATMYILKIYLPNGANG